MTPNPRSASSATPTWLFGSGRTFSRDRTSSSSRSSSTSPSREPSLGCLSRRRPPRPVVLQRPAFSPRSGRARPEEGLGWAPEHFVEWVCSWADSHPAVIQLSGNPEPTLFADLDPALVAKSEPREVRAAFLELVAGSKMNWVIVSAPTEGWARQVFGEPDVERLWGAVATATRLDEPDPVAAWQDHATALKARAAALNDRGFDAIRFRGPGTDLTVGLLPASRWMCATFSTETGIEHPEPSHRRGVHDSRLAADRGHSPLDVPAGRPRWGVLVEGLQLRFERGKAVEVNADEGGDAVAARLASSPGVVSRRDRARRRRLAGAARAWSSRTRFSTRTRRVTSRTDRGSR